MNTTPLTSIVADSPTLQMGIDVGSTTVKIVLRTTAGEVLYSKYCRHHANITPTIYTLVKDAAKGRERSLVKISITGSGGMSLAEHLNIPFTQEVIAGTRAIREFYPETSVIIELGGEDAKLTYLGAPTEHRMNGSCAGGTGAFIDQMATLLHTDASGLNEAAEKATTLYSIAARCGVFAKTDVQALMNQGATRENIALSVFQAIVNQTITGLSCGRKIEGKVAFLGGPLTFLPVLREQFCKTLQLSEENRIIPKRGELFVALGAALCSSDCAPRVLADFVLAVEEQLTIPLEETQRLTPLFNTFDELEEFRQRHGQNIAPHTELSQVTGPCYLGLDAGSTTMKAVVIDHTGAIAYSYYGPNKGIPLEKAKSILSEIYSLLPPSAYIAQSGVTGYGEDLLKEALKIDIGEVETIAHYQAARHFCPDVSFILDIGGQDMKCCKIKDGYIEDIVLNEACSSGCGSFLDTFAASMGITTEAFASIGLMAPAPIDLGSRCTVFMNSKVKQGQKEGASIADIAAGLSYSVIKNALYKVIKVKNPEELGPHIVVQGGTFYNESVLRAFEQLLGRTVIRPNTAGLMGAYGMALLAREACASNDCTHSSLLTLEEVNSFHTEISMRNCGLCTNNCMLTVNTFSDGRTYITGNRCERSLGNDIKPATTRVPNLVAAKLCRLFDYYTKRGISSHHSKGRVGLPRVLNMYEDYPFWHTFFTTLGYEVVLSDITTKPLYESAMDTIPSDTACYPAKIVHGHIKNLVQKDVDFIFYPCVQSGPVEYSVDNNFHCPMVVSYPELIRNNMQEVLAHTPFYAPFLPLDNKKKLTARLLEELSAWGEKNDAIKNAVKAAWKEQLHYKEAYYKMTRDALEQVQKNNLPSIVLAGRPYHVDNGINHGIPELIHSLGIAVFTEDGIAPLGKPVEKLRVVDQWSYHSRLYRAAEYVSHTPHMELVELNSFGCGLDSIVADQVKEILGAQHKIHTLLKIDEGANLGAVKIRLRSLKSVMSRKVHEQETVHQEYSYHRAIFTPEMKSEYTILVPQMSPYHFPFLKAAFEHEGFHIDLLPHAGHEAIDRGLQYIHNDACYPAIMVLGQIIHALQSGKYDINKTAVIISQTGGSCRATNYIGYLRKALVDAGLGQVPILSLNSQGMEKQPGFTFGFGFIHRLLQSVVYGDVLMQVLYATRPYEAIPGSAEKLVQIWQERLLNDLVDAKRSVYTRNIKEIIAQFDRFLTVPRTKPRVGIVGEIYVKFHPDANNHIVNLIEKEGGEVITSGLLDFFLYCSLDKPYQAKYLSGSLTDSFVSVFNRKILEWYRAPYEKAIAESQNFDHLHSIQKIAKKSSQFLSLGHQAGEGWFLTGDMIDLIEKDARNIVCLQPFGCLPNHVTGKGMIRSLSSAYPNVHITAIDYDPGASEVNQTNRLKLLLTGAFEHASGR